MMSARPSTREVFETGVRFTTESGDLSILSDRPQLLAKYGSGNWLSVYVDDNVTVVSEKPAESSDDSFDFGGFGDDDSSSSDATDTDSDSADAESDTDSDTADAPADEETASV